MNMAKMLLYIDPGTGAMLFSVLMGIVSAAFFLLQKVVLKAKFLLSGGKVKKETENRIPYVIFSDSKRYWNVFEPICDVFEARGIACEYWTASPDDPALDKAYAHVKTRFIGEGNKAYAVLNLMNADICLATTPGLDVYQWKRSKNARFYVHIVHEIGEVLMYRMFGTDYFDAVLLSGEFQKEGIRKLEDIRKLDQKELVVVGSTYMDSMMKRRKDEAYAECAATLEKPADNCAENRIMTVLVAPTWGISSILNRYGERFLQAVVDTGYRVIVRPHPQSFISDPDLMEQLRQKFPEGDRFEWNRDNDNFDVLNRADIMISDFSGVVFDFSIIFDKPILYTNTGLDLAPYDAAWMDAPIWRKEVLPRLGEELNELDFDNLKLVIDQLLSDEVYQKGRDYVRDTAWQYRGESAERVVDYLVHKHECICGDEAGKNAKNMKTYDKTVGDDLVC